MLQHEQFTIGLESIGEYGTCDTVPVNDGRGRPPKISPTDAKKLLKIIKEPASKYGFENDLWNTERIRIVWAPSKNGKEVKQIVRSSE